MLYCSMHTSYYILNIPSSRQLILPHWHIRYSRIMLKEHLEVTNYLLQKGDIRHMCKI